MTLKEMQIAIISNRVKRNWKSATDLSKTTLGLAEEVGEFEKARKKNNIAEQIDALGDIIIFALGGMEILGQDAETVLIKIIVDNQTRTHDGTH